MAIRLYAITVADAQHAAPPADTDGAGLAPTFVPFRDLCAVVSEQKAFGLDEPTPESVAAHQAVVDAVFRRGAVLPAPVGVVFRAPDVLKRWMELHYVSLTDALEFVEDRAVARVHIERADGKAERARGRVGPRRGGVRIAPRAAPEGRRVRPASDRGRHRARAERVVPRRARSVEGLPSRRRRAARRAPSPSLRRHRAVGAVRFRAHAVRRLTHVLPSVRDVESRGVGDVPAMQRAPARARSRAVRAA